MMPTTRLSLALGRLLFLAAVLSLTCEPEPTRAAMGPLSRTSARLAASLQQPNFGGGHLHAPSDIITRASELYYENQVDHFSVTDQSTYAQRYFLDATHWKKGLSPIFFYAGNEADVTGYVNVTGLMWENAEAFGAMVVFAEHRYYGRSMPTAPSNPKYLSHEQALADYVELVRVIKSNYSEPEAPVVVFGGSYGGMLAAWARIKYPSTFIGAIAASAPIFAYFGAGNDFYNNGGAEFWRIVTQDAEEPDDPAVDKALCDRSRYRAAFNQLFAIADSQAGRQRIAQALDLCDDIDQENLTVLDVATWLVNAFDNMAMGNYPFPSSYLTGSPNVFMPAFPARRACSIFAEHSQAGSLSSSTSDNDDDDGLQLVRALGKSAAVFNNASQSMQCFHINHDDKYDGIWDWQWCSEMLPEETFFSSLGEGGENNDMFFPLNVPFRLSNIKARCHKLWQIEPQPFVISEQYGTKLTLHRSGATNIVFSNGLLDPWSAGGVKRSLSPSLQSVILPNGAHHLDLMFSHPDDTQDVLDARNVELAAIRRWLQEYESSFSGDRVVDQPTDLSAMA